MLLSLVAMQDNFVLECFITGITRPIFSTGSIFLLLVLAAVSTLHMPTEGRGCGEELATLQTIVLALLLVLVVALCVVFTICICTSTLSMHVYAYTYARICTRLS